MRVLSASFPLANRLASSTSPAYRDATRGAMRVFPLGAMRVFPLMDQFPIVGQKDEEAHGAYRTKDQILQIYDAMLDAHRSGAQYQTCLCPPPGQIQTTPKA
jgi:hypothetical protein